MKKEITHYNNFDLLRLIAASFVLLSHSFNVYGKHDLSLISSIEGYENISFGVFGVSIFFAISGFLVTKSRTLTPKGEQFMIKRLLRLYPAIYLNMVIVYFFIVPITIATPVFEYFSMAFKNIPLLLASGVFFESPSLTGIFEANHTSSVVNMSLWTLFYELACYLIILLCGSVFNIKRNIPLVTIAFAAYFCNSILFPRSNLDLAAVYCCTFLLGSCFFLYKEYIPLKAVVALLCAICLMVLFIANIYFIPLYLLSVTYLSLYVALRLRYFGNFAKYGDLSYGIYIYAWPVQQTVAISFAFSSALFPVYMVVSLLIVIIFAFFSWHVIERPAIMLKAKLK
jgi:peptidoglycan/LPS O-acetylase OafA/YrhL